MHIIKPLKVILCIALLMVLFLPNVVSANEQFTYIQWFDKGYVYQQNKSYNEAIWAYSEAIKLNPEFSIAYNNRGDMYLYSGRTELAFDDYYKAIELGSQIPSAFLYSGGYYFGNGLYDLAIDDFNKAIKLDTHYGLAYYFRGLLYGQTKQYELALADVDKAIELIPWDVPNIAGLPTSVQSTRENQLLAIYLIKGTICEQSGNFNEAIASYKQSLQYLRNCPNLSKKELVEYKEVLNEKIKKLGG
jgi:tetratricopeptide (TPR) repeat protein